MNINEGQSIWIEKYRPTCTDDLVLPDYIKDKFRKYAEKEDIPNLGLFSANPGCILPGTKIQVKSPRNWLNKKQIVSKYNLTNKEYTFLKGYVDVKKTPRYDYIDDNSVSGVLLKATKSSYKYRKFYHLDEMFSNKFLKFRYWLTKYSVRDAYKKVIRLRKYKSYFEFDENNLPKNFKNIDALLKTQLEIIYNEDFKIPESCRKVEFWVFRGYTEEEAIQKVKEIQNNSDKIDYKKTITTTNIAYYLNKGYTLEESKQMLSERQRTFSLKKCIEKYGEEIGLDVFNARQEKWQNTLKSKSQKEIDRINMSKGSKPKTKGKCILYYIRIYNDDISFYKVGITTRTVQKRWSELERSGLDYEILLEVEFNTVSAAYNVEQIILKNPKKNNQKA